MKSFIKQLHTAAHDIRLSHAERRHIHTTVMQVLIERENRSIPSPYATPFFMRFGVAAFVIVLIISVSGGTAYAAQGSLPGDTLYPVKVNVTEPIEVALAVTQEQKASVNNRIAEERLIEAKTLAASGRLTPGASAMLAANFASHANAASAAASAVETQDPASADLITADFSNTVAAEGSAILTAAAGNASTSRVSSDFVVSVASQASDVADAEANIVASTTNPPPAPDAAKRAHKALSDLNTAVSHSNNIVAKTRAAAIANLVVKADAEASLGSTSAANQDYTQALATVNAIQTTIQVPSKTVSPSGK